MSGTCRGPDPVAGGVGGGRRPTSPAQMSRGVPESVWVAAPGHTEATAPWGSSYSGSRILSTFRDVVFIFTG